MVGTTPGVDLFRGIHAVLFALFQRDETLDFGAMRAELEYCIEKGADGITILGLATEVLKLSFNERTRLIEVIGDALNARLPYSVTIVGNSLHEQKELIAIAKGNGADWLILQPPLIGNYPAEIYLKFFENVARMTSLPIAIQNAPQYLGRSLGLSDIHRLQQAAPNLVAIKSEESADMIGEAVKRMGHDIAILGGRGGLEMIESLEAGARGFVLAPDIAPLASRIYRAYQAGDKEKAGALYARALPAIEYSMQSLEHLAAYGKRFFGMNAGIKIHDRAPALDVDDADLQELIDYANALLPDEMP